MLRMQSDLVPALLAARDGMLRNFDLRFSRQSALTIVLAAQGYPGAYAKGSEIGGLDAAQAEDGVEIFHAGTVAEGACVLAAGGRVLNVCALGSDIAQAQARAYRAAGLIRWPQGFYRRDIGWRALERERAGAV